MLPTDETTSSEESADLLEAVLSLVADGDSPSSPSPPSESRSVRDMSGLRGPYFFPDAKHRARFDGSIQAMTDEELGRRLRELVDKTVAGSPGPLDHAWTRDEACALGLAWNKRKTLAPAFRPFRRAQRRGLKAHMRSEAERWIVADRLVLDVDWLRTRADVAPIPELQHLLAGDQLDVAAASAYASRQTTAGRRAADFGLPEHERLLVTSFHDDATLCRAKTINEGTLKTRRVLLDRLPHTKHRLSPERVNQLLAAYRALRIARGSADLGSRVVAHVEGGCVMDAQQLRDAKKKLSAFGCDVDR